MMIPHRFPFTNFRSCLLCCWIAAVAVAVVPGLYPAAEAQDFLWLEGERPSRVNIPQQAAGVGHPEFLSERAWFQAAIDANQVDRDAPAEGVLVDYAFDTSSRAEYGIWARIGYEFVRSPFEWRLDDGAWNSVSPEVLTTDLMELSFWTEVAWLKLGKQPLAAGPHTLSFRVPKTKDAQGKPQRILFALDCVCLAAGEFHPYQFHKPGEDHQTDRDRTAAAHTFRLPAATAPEARVSVPLAGLWEICRHDETLPGPVAAPIQDFPAAPRWTAIEVPGDKNQRDDLVFAHRLWYRTRVDVPDTLAGRSMVLVFPANNLNTTLYVNGQLCGFDKNPFARLQFDITKAVRPGVNEVWVGIKDGWYGYQADPADPLKLRRRWNLPLKFFSNGFQELVYPIWNQTRMGIVGTPQWIAAGPTYTADVFCKPSVADKRLGVEITIQNNRPAAAQASVLIEAVNDLTGEVEMHWGPLAVDGRAGQTVLTDQLAWDQPKLWWPDEPNCYRLRTTVQRDDQAVDVQETLFGFRQWTIDGIHLRLNGVKWQGFTEHGVPGSTPEEHLASLKNPKFNYGFSRMWPQHGGRYQWLGQEPDEVLSFMDRGGALIRRTGYLDGEAAGYMPAVLPELGKNWIDHLTAWIKGERNHPCIMIWSVENELNFINARNLGALDKWEPVLTRAWQAIQQVDPTRPIMIDGGGATRAQTLPVHGDHYSTKPFWNYPQLAYEANADQREWTWDQQRPKFIGEELFAAGINPAYAYFGGEQVFLGKAGNRPAVGKAMQVISQGYRWFGVAACDFCQQPSDADGSQYNAWAPRAVLVRQWDDSFASGRTAKRTVGIFNNTRFADPLSFAWTLTLDGRTVVQRSTVHAVPPGENEKFDVELPIPNTTRRLEGQWTLTLAAEGKEVFRAVKEISVLPSGRDRTKPPALARLQAGDLFVYDPQGNTAAFLRSHAVALTPLTSLDPPPAPGKIWLIGADALTAADTSSTAFAAYAAGGGRVLLLEQEHPLRYQGLGPAEVEFQLNVGRTAFAEDVSHPLLRGLQDKDFFTWEPGEVVYKNAYLKPQRGARSLVQCNESLLNSALLSVPINDGLLTLCQLVVGEKLADHPAAETLLFNALDYSAGYRLEFLPAAAAVEPPLAKVLDSINLQYATADDPSQALAQSKIAVVSASAANLKSLAADTGKLQAFYDGGGWLILHDVTPDGLADFNRIVGFEHIMRPFRRERVTFAVPRSGLLAGVSLSDVALYSSEKIFAWQAGHYVASDTFRYVVDGDEVAPFGTWDSDAWYNFVNGMVSADGWKYIQNHPAENRTYGLTLPKPQELVGWTWDGNIFYNPTHQVELVFDGDEAGKLSFAVPPDGEPATFDIDPPRSAKQITVRHAQFDDIPAKRQNGVQIIGCDNLAFYAQRPADFRERVRPLLNVGGLVEYPRGPGGIVLVNLLFQEPEEVPANASKKRSVLASILRNLGAPFGGSKTVVAGAPLTYSPIDLSKHANQYRTERGWFGDARWTLKDLPVGAQKLAGVSYDIYDFPTSPVPTCIMLAGPKVPGQLPAQVTGIPVNRRADALFFLHTARIDRRRNEKEKKDGQQHEIVRYVIRYADGRDEVLPIYSELDIDDYRVKQPQALPGAQLAWTRPYEGTEFHAAVYAKQWTNPRPEVEIRSLDIVSGDSDRGTAALLAVTAASVP
jgi:beta-galactosidase